MTEAEALVRAEEIVLRLEAIERFMRFLMDESAG